MDHDEMGSTRKYMAKCNLEAETPTKSFCNQVNKSKKRVKLQCLLQERKLTPEEPIATLTKSNILKLSAKKKYRPK